MHSPDSVEAKNDENDFAFAITAKVLSNGDEKTASLDAFKKVDSNVKLFGSTIEAKKWTTYPGFFAKGGLDVMTSFLLDSIFEEDKSSSARLKEDVYGDTKKPPKRVMDFGCGSGILGYALRHAIGGKEKEKRTKKKKVKLTVLDADAVSAAGDDDSALCSASALHAVRSEQTTAPSQPRRGHVRPGYCEMINAQSRAASAAEYNTLLPHAAFFFLPEKGIHFVQLSLPPA